jgi:hypothetical protein
MTAEQGLRMHGVSAPAPISARGIPRTRAIAAAVLLIVVPCLPGCGIMGDEVAVKALMSPSKFELYACKDIEAYGRKTHAREQELRQMMARAGEATGGAIVNVIAYRNEYVQVRAELASLSEAAAKKNCTSQSPWASERSLF